MQSIITLSGVSLELPNGRTLFSDINFSLSSNLTALVGPNGVGKTSLAKIMTGELPPTSGSVRRSSGLGFLPQREVPPPMTVEAYLANRYSWSAIGEKLLSKIDRESLCSTLSGGQWMRVRLAAILEDQFLILDEPSNDLDVEAKMILKDFLQTYRPGVLLISHDRDFLCLCEDVLELSSQGLQKYGGGWEKYEAEKERERQQSLAELERAKRERDRAKEDRAVKLEQQEKKNRQGRKEAKKGGMPKILIGARKRKAESTTGAIDAETMLQAQEKVKNAHQALIAIKAEPIMYADLVGAEIPAQKLVAEARDFNVSFGSWLYAKDLNFTWRGNIRLAIHGGNGSGKSTLIKALLGTPMTTRGELRVGSLATLYIDQQCSLLDESLNILENVRRSSRMTEGEVRNNLAKLLFTGDAVFQKVTTLSGGEQLRAALACGLLAEQKPELLIMDEPTNNLDLGNIKFLEDLISHFKGAVIIVSHDRTFLRECGIDRELNL